MIEKIKAGATDRDFGQVRVFDAANAKDIAYGWAYYFPVPNIWAITPVFFWNRFVDAKSEVYIKFVDGTEKQVIEQELSHTYRAAGW